MDPQSSAAEPRVAPLEPRVYEALFRWRELRFHVVTTELLTAEQTRVLAKAALKVSRVGLFAELVATVLGQHVRIRTTRPSLDVRFEVGRAASGGSAASL